MQQCIDMLQTYISTDSSVGVRLCLTLLLSRIDMIKMKRMLFLRELTDTHYSHAKEHLFRADVVSHMTNRKAALSDAKIMKDTTTLDNG